MSICYTRAIHQTKGLDYITKACPVVLSRPLLHFLVSKTAVYPQCPAITASLTAGLTVVTRMLWGHGHNTKLAYAISSGDGFAKESPLSHNVSLSDDGRGGAGSRHRCYARRVEVQILTAGGTSLLSGRSIARPPRPHSS